MLKVLLLVFTSSVLLLCADAPAQTKADAQDRRPGDASQKQGPDLGTPEEEMLRRAQIKHEEDSHKELVGRAGEMAQIGNESLDSFNKSKSVSGTDDKKLTGMGQIAHKIENDA